MIGFNREIKTEKQHVIIQIFCRWFNISRTLTIFMMAVILSTAKTIN